MIIQENFKINDTDLVRSYSDQNVMICQIETGNLYDEAVDVSPCPYHYEETEIPVPSESDGDMVDDDLAEYAQAGKILMGEG